MQPTKADLFQMGALPAPSTPWWRLVKLHAQAVRRGWYGRVEREILAPAREGPLCYLFTLTRDGDVFNARISERGVWRDEKRRANAPEEEGPAWTLLDPIDGAAPRDYLAFARLTRTSSAPDMLRRAAAILRDDYEGAGDNAPGNRWLRDYQRLQKRGGA